MGRRWLSGQWIDALRDYGATLEFFPGYETRSRSSGGFEEILAIGLHHDAIRAGVPTSNRANAGWINAASRPVGNLITRRNGNLLLGALGASNTQGRSERAHVFSKGTVPQSQGNMFMVANEIECDGVGQPYTPEQVAGVEAFCAATCDVYGLDPMIDIMSHHRYTSRKIDPLGFTPGRPWGPGEWNDYDVGLSIVKIIKNGKGTDMGISAIETPFRWLDTRESTRWHSGPLTPGVPLVIPAPFNMKQMGLSVTVLGAKDRGFIKIYGEHEPDTSVVNYNATPGLPPLKGNTIVKASSSGHITVKAFGAPVHVLIDVEARD